MAASPQSWLPGRAASSSVPAAGLQVDLAQLRRNAKSLHGKFGKMAVVVKTNAYGHGIAKVAPVFAPFVEYFCVCDNKDATILRAAGVKNRVCRIRCATLEEVRDCVEKDLKVEESVGSLQEAMQLDSFAEAWGAGAMNVHLLLDVGMGRMAFSSSSEAAKVLSFKNLRVRGVMTHFPCADDDDQNITKGQIEKFQSMFAELHASGKLDKDVVVHVGNSDASHRFAEVSDGKTADMVRMGNAFFGLDPYKSGLAKDVKPAMQWTTRLACVRTVQKGSTVGYGSTFRCPQDMVIGTLPVGWGNGYHVGLSGKGAQVLLRGKRIDVVGKISMNVTCVDLSSVEDAKLGEEVCLLGRQGLESIHPDELASKLNLNSSVVCIHAGYFNAPHVTYTE